MKTFVPDEKVIYMMEVGPGNWYRIPHQMVLSYLSRGSIVRERRNGTGWVQLNNADFAKTPSGEPGAK